MSPVFAEVKLQCVQSIPQGYIAKMSLCLFPRERQQMWQTPGLWQRKNTYGYRTEAWVFAELLCFTYANRFGFVPAGLAISPHDASECGVSLQRIAVVTVIGDSCPQLQLSTNTSTITHQAWLKARLSGIFCWGKETQSMVRGIKNERQQYIMIYCYSGKTDNSVHTGTFMYTHTLQAPNVSKKLALSSK